MTKFDGKFFILISMVISTFVNCEKKSSSPILARVGNSVLTVEDLDKSIPSEYNNAITQEQNVDYVKQWIQTELLYREAIHRKIDREPQMKNRLGEMKKNLLAAEMISRLQSTNESSSIDESSISDYYNRHKDEFIRESDVAKYLEIIVDDQKTAWHIIKNANADNFLEYASKYSNLVASNLSYIPYVSLNELPPDIAQTISTCKIDGITKPISSELGFHVILVLDKLPKGEICLLEEVRGDIIDRLSTKKQKQGFEKLLSELRLKTNVEFNADLIPGNKFENVIKDSLVNKQDIKEN